MMMMLRRRRQKRSKETRESGKPAFLRRFLVISDLFPSGADRIWKAGLSLLGLPNT